MSDKTTQLEDEFRVSALKRIIALGGLLLADFVVEVADEESAIRGGGF